MTELQAVNLLLSAIGEAAVSSLETATTVEVTQAKNLLSNVNRAAQQKGWHFNTEYDYPLVPDSVTSKITLPVNTLKVDLDPELNTDTDAVQRGLKLYDRKNHRETWTKDLKAIITFELEFEELPEQFRHYISVKSARIFAARFLGSREIEGFALRDEIEAKARAIESDSENADRTIFDHYSVLRVLDR